MHLSQAIFGDAFVSSFIFSLDAFNAQRCTTTKKLNIRINRIGHIDFSVVFVPADFDSIFAADFATKFKWFADLNF